MFGVQRHEKSPWRGPARVLGSMSLMSCLLVVRSVERVEAAPTPAPSCATGVGVGGTNSATLSMTRGGNGCAVIVYVAGGATQYETFNYAGADQTWTGPSGVSSAPDRGYIEVPSPSP